MIRHQYSYWLRLEGPVDVRKRANEWLREHGTCPDFIRLTVSEEPNVSSYEVPNDSGTIEETPDIWDAINGLASAFPALSIYFDELDEEDHSIERHTYWHDGKMAQAYGEAISNEMIRLKAEDPKEYRLKKLMGQFKEALLSRGDSPDEAEQLAEALANGQPVDVKPQESNITYCLSVEGPKQNRQSFSERIMENSCLSYKKFLWPSFDTSFYIGHGTPETEDRLVKDINAAVSGFQNLIVFLEESEDNMSSLRWHCWNSNRHAFIEANDGLLYESELDLRDLLLDLCKHPERYSDSFSETAQVEDITPKTVKEETQDIRIPRLAGGFCLVKSIDLDNRDNEELPVLLAAKEDFLLAFANKKGYDSLEEFYSKHTAKDVQDLEYQASCTRNMAFSFHTETGELAFPMLMKSDDVLAIIDFISGKLQENGFTDASKYLDCLFDL